MRVRHLLLFTRDMDRSLRFWARLGLQTEGSSQQYAELKTLDGLTLALRHSDSEAHHSCGYSAQLHCDIVDMDSALPQLVALGGALDGPVKYPAFGKVASLRSPEGLMLGLFEPATKV